MNIVLQWALNIIFVGGIFWLWYQFEKIKTRNTNSAYQQSLSAFESRLAFLESEVETLRQKIDEKNKILDSVSDQLQRAVKNQKLAGLGFPITQEETDLKEAMYLGVERDVIPSVVQFESTKLRLQNETCLDLKTLLKGQLS